MDASSSSSSLSSLGKRRSSDFYSHINGVFIVISLLSSLSQPFVLSLLRKVYGCLPTSCGVSASLSLCVCVLAMSIVRRFGLESPEELVLGRREGDGCSGASTDSSDFSATSSSSIGRDSDASGRLSDDEDGGENEVQSYRLCEEPLDMMASLEEALPFRRGISKFYDGKCKSFTTISDAASTSSIKDIAKSENAYARKRRNLLAFSHIWEKKSRTISRRNSGIGISKRPISSSRSTLALAVAMSSCDSISSQDSNSRSPPLPLTSSGNNYLASLVMHPPYNFSTWGSRSISVTDLQRCASSATFNTSQSSITNTSK